VADHGQSWDPERYARNAGFVAELGLPLVELLAPKPGERILDLGCGDGVLSQRLVDLGAEVVAVDSSSEQVTAARARGLDARVLDAQALTFDHEFDAVFSNAALHWMRRPDAVIAGVRRALLPGGRFVGEFGGGDNVGRVKRALIAALDRRGLDGTAAVPWYFPDSADYRARLEAGGFRVDTLALIERPTPLPGSLLDWLDTFAESFVGRLPARERAAFKAEVAEALAPALRNPDGSWWVDYVRLRFAATLDTDSNS
jgi:trans-aconitate methyltransferase